MTPAAVGVRVKSGRAVAVVVTEGPEVRLRSDLDLSDPGSPDTRQPYHASFGRLEENPAVLRKRVELVGRAAQASVRALLSDARSRGFAISAAGLVVGSTIDPDTIANPHIRAHAFEGRLFRTVVEDALAAAGVPSRAIVEREAFAKAASELAQSEDELRRTVGAQKRHVEGPWRADEKLAMLAAWMAFVPTADLSSVRRADLLGPPRHET